MQRDAQPADFRLRKLYIDCVSPAGAVAIAYSGSIRWKSFETGASNITVFDTDANAHTRWMLSSVDALHDGPDLLWNAPRLGCTIAARSGTGGFAERLLHDDRGDIDWDCIVPVADVSVEFDGLRIEGKGYAELIELTIPPWALPVDRLRWGRFIGGDQSLVWIEWQGPHPLAQVWRNGRCLTPEAVANDRIVVDGSVTLEMQQVRVLRTGSLERLLAPVDALLRMFPVGRIHETRWLSAGQLHSGNADVTTGWVVHEEVCFR